MKSPLHHVKIFSLFILSVCSGQAIAQQATVHSNISAKDKRLAVKTVKGTDLPAIKIDEFIAKQMDSLKIPALSIAIINNDKVVYSKTVGTKNSQKDPVDDQTMFEAASMTKPVFAYVVMQLIKEHVLDLDTPLYTYYPYPDIATDERYKLITARMVLDHTTGFPNWRGDGKLTINFTPGIKFGYSGEGYGYLSLVLEHLTGKKADVLMKQYAIDPLAMKNSYMKFNPYVDKHLVDGIKDNNERARNGAYVEPHVAYSLYTNALEYAQLVMRFIKESQTSNSVFQSMATPQIEVNEPDMDPNVKMDMGLGVFIQKTPYGTKYFHAGSNGNCYNSLFQFYKDSKVGAVYFIIGCKQGEFAARLDKFLISGK